MRSPKRLSLPARFAAVCLGVALAVVGLAIFRTSWSSSPTEQIAAARLEPTSVPIPNEHFHDELPKIVVPPLAVSVPQSPKTVVAMTRLAPAAVATPAAHRHDVRPKIVAPHRAVSTPNAREKIVAMVPHESNGWYVFLPPGDPQHKSPDLSAPLKRWTQDESFGSAEECEDYRARVISKAASDRDSGDGPTDALNYRIRLFTYAECVSAQDPRLADRHLAGQASLAASDSSDEGSDRPDEGYYIFLPPGYALHRSPDPSAPFQRWTQGEAFDTAENCEDYREHEISDAAYDRDHADGPADELDYKVKLFTYAQCVSAQDRRIKEKK